MMPSPLARQQLQILRADGANSRETGGCRMAHQKPGSGDRRTLPAIADRGADRNRGVTETPPSAVPRGAFHDNTTVDYWLQGGTTLLLRA